MITFLAYFLFSFLLAYTFIAILSGANPCKPYVKVLKRLLKNYSNER